MAVSFSIPANIVLESIIIIIHIYVLAEKEFTVEKTYVYSSLGLMIWMLIVSIAWCYYFTRSNAEKKLKFLRFCKIIRGFEAILSCSVAVALVLTVKSSELSKNCRGFNYTTTKGPCQRFALMILAAILSVMNGLLYFFHPVPNSTLENMFAEKLRYKSSRSPYPRQQQQPQQQPQSNSIYPSLDGINPGEGHSMEQTLPPSGTRYFDASFNAPVPTMSTALGDSTVQPHFMHHTNPEAPSIPTSSNSGL